jgi:hypothetical protein
MIFSFPLKDIRIKQPSSIYDDKKQSNISEIHELLEDLAPLDPLSCRLYPGSAEDVPL